MPETNDKTLVIEVVEDEYSIAQSLHDAFERQDVSVLVAKNGEEGLKVALKHHPALILLDIVMPKVDGLTMLAELRKNPWGKDVPVIALTNYGDPEKVARATELGIREYLIKADWNLEDVIRMVKEKIGAN